MTIKGQLKDQLKCLVAISYGLIAIQNTSIFNKERISEGLLRYTLSLGRIYILFYKKVELRFLIRLNKLSTGLLRPKNVY